MDIWERFMVGRAMEAYQRVCVNPTIRILCFRNDISLVKCKVLLSSKSKCQLEVDGFVGVFVHAQFYVQRNQKLDMLWLFHTLVWGLGFSFKNKEYFAHLVFHMLCRHGLHRISFDVTAESVFLAIAFKLECVAQMHTFFPEWLVKKVLGSKKGVVFEVDITTVKRTRFIGVTTSERDSRPWTEWLAKKSLRSFSGEVPGNSKWTMELMVPPMFVKIALSFPWRRRRWSRLRNWQCCRLLF